TIAMLRSYVGLDSVLMWRLGIGIDSDSPMLYEQLLYDDGSPEGERARRRVEILEEGAEAEDDFPRSLNHFYDPVSGNGFIGSPSPEWALDEPSNPLQAWSYRDMLDAMYSAMMAANEDEASRQYAVAFKALGHVVHHIQDMAQPQHARLDSHCNLVWTCYGDVYEPSFYEWLSTQMASGGLVSEGGVFIVTPS